MANEHIRREDAIDIVRHECGEWRGLAKEIVKQFNGLPSADVAPVVRCENCIHWSDSNQCARPELSGSRWHDPKYFDTYPDDFCSYGERSKQE